MRVTSSPARAEHVELDGDVGDVGLLHLERGLHLGEAPSAAPALENVHGDEDVVCQEGGLEDNWSAVGDGPPGLLHFLLQSPVLAIHEDAAREALPRQLSHAAAPVEDDLEPRVGYELGRVGLVDAPPELLHALDPLAVAGLREPGAL